MKDKTGLLSIFASLLIICGLLVPQVVQAASAENGDYCQVPPFIGVTEPNVVLLIDNSASMYDPQYVDIGQTVCSNDSTVTCTSDADCSNGGTCSDQTRKPTYCYDETYSNSNDYYGYFSRTLLYSTQTQYYSYDFTNQYFVPVSTFPSDAASCGSDTVKFIDGTLCVDIDTSTSPYSVKTFIASGDYLNWLTASKFDEEKAILTGGKYGSLGGTTDGLIAETRGCVGRDFVKQPLTTDFQNYSSTDTDPNIANQLGITFGVRGPVDQSNPTAVSTGGQTYIDVFYGNYDAGKCQQAIDDYEGGTASKQTIVDDVNTCLNNSATNQKTCQNDTSITCKSDCDCINQPGVCGGAGTTGTCNFGSTGNGLCEDAGLGDGVCSNTSGTCSGNGVCVGGKDAGNTCSTDSDCPNGSGSQGYCSKTCVGGGKAGATCSNDTDCSISVCTAPAVNVGEQCSTDTDCDTKSCSNTTLVKNCTDNSQCNTGTCSNSATTTCVSDADCSTHTCGPGPLEHDLCSPDGESYSTENCTSGTNWDWDCSSNYGHCLAPVTTQIKSTFTQSMNSCYQYEFNNTDVGQNEYTMVANPQGCNQIYDQYRICSGGSRDGQQCSTDTSDSSDCPGGGKCIGGPNAIRPGSPVLLCSTAYAGYCASSPDNWTTTKSTTNWLPREYDSAKDCILAQFRNYCGALDMPPVTDPTTDPSNTGSYLNLPAVINDLGIASQLNSPISTLTVDIATPAAPTGLIQKFSSEIRIGAMAFDFNGSATECATRDDAAGTVSGGPAYCSDDKTRTCTSDSDCGTNGAICEPVVPCPLVCDSNSNDPGSPCSLLPGGTTADCPGGSCIQATNGTTNEDSAAMLPASYVGDTVPVTPDGGHTTAGVINSIDNLRADSWTPFSEGLYNAIGYYALTDSTTASDVMRINTNDFNLTPIPSQNNCQKNNVLLITDGQATADLNSKITDTISTNSGLFPSTDFSLNYDTLSGNTISHSGYACTNYVPYDGSRNVEPLAWLAQHRDIQDFSLQAPQNYAQKVATYTVYTGDGDLDSDTCSNYTDSDLAGLDDCLADNLMCKTARYGGGLYFFAQDPASLRTALENAFLAIAAKATSGTAASVLASGEGSGANLIQALFYPRREFDFNTETYWAGSLQNLWYYVDPFFTNSNIREDTPDATTGLQDHILNLKEDYIAQMPDTSDATDVPVTLVQDVNGDGSQLTTIANTDIEHIHPLWEAGKLLWERSPSLRKIYTDCNLKNGSSTCLTDSNSHNLGVMNFTPANDTVLEPYLQVSDADQASQLISWVTGYDKFCTDTDTPCTVDSDCTYPATCSDNPYRMRTVTIDVNGNKIPETDVCSGSPTIACSSDSDCPDNESCGETHVWKLGDVLNSTPRIASWLPLNHYNITYWDNTYGQPKEDLPYDQDSDKYFTSDSYAAEAAVSSNPKPGYRDRGMVFAGANDGMLHAFRLGTLELTWTGQGTYQKARLLRTCTGDHTKQCTKDSDCGSGQGTCPVLGQEMWAFIPKAVLPYLNYMANKEYCHVYSVDLTPYLFDASIEGPDTSCADAGTGGTGYWNCTKTKDSWRTILIGGMRYGGACKTKVCSVTTTTKCASDSDCPSGETCVDPSSDDVGTPILDPADSSKGFGYSSYFALDVTDSLVDPSAPPQLLWEFSNENLGFSTSGPAIVRISTKPKDSNNDGNFDWKDDADNDLDGKWFVVIGSGPTGPIANRQFSGSSDQDLRYFILDLKTGQLVRTIDSQIQNAFSGSLFNGMLDANAGEDVTSKGPEYQDDVVYGGYVKKCSTTNTICTGGTWTDGGVERLLTRGDMNPDHWELSNLIDGIGPVTSAVSKLIDTRNNNLWLYFGTGRFFYKTATAQDDIDGQRTIFGVTEPCYTSGAPHFQYDCLGETRTRDQLDDVTDIADVPTAAPNPNPGWYINLAPSYNDSDPTLSLGAERVITDPLATTAGAVYFTTFAPYKTLCTLGGKSYIWAVTYDTGGNAGAILKGKAILQVSTGAIVQLNMGTEFTASGGRKTAGQEGVPPVAQGLSILSSPPPVQKLVHMRER